jgi:hypothetical protein
MPQLQPRRNTRMATRPGRRTYLVQCMWLALCEADAENGRRQGVDSNGVKSEAQAFGFTTFIMTPLR